MVFLLLRMVIILQSGNISILHTCIKQVKKTLKMSIDFGKLNGENVYPLWMLVSATVILLWDESSSPAGESSLPLCLERRESTLPKVTTLLQSNLLHWLGDLEKREPGLLTQLETTLKDSWVSLVARTVKNLPAMQETQVPSLGWEAPLEKGMAIHSNILAWRITWTEKPGRLLSTGSQRVGNDRATITHTVRRELRCWHGVAQWFLRHSFTSGVIRTGFDFILNALGDQWRVRDVM